MTSPAVQRTRSVAAGDGRQIPAHSRGSGRARKQVSASSQPVDGGLGLSRAAATSGIGAVDRTARPDAGPAKGTGTVRGGRPRPSTSVRRQDVAGVAIEAADLAQVCGERAGVRACRRPRPPISVPMESGRARQRAVVGGPEQALRAGRNSRCAVRETACWRSAHVDDATRGDRCRRATASGAPS